MRWAGKTPAEVYKVEERRAFKPMRYAYPGHFRVRRVSKNGRISLGDETYFVSESLTGFDVGVEPVDGMHVRAWFRDVDLGLIEIVPGSG